jgi:sarcosine oxidase gamma subunit
VIFVLPTAAAPTFSMAKYTCKEENNMKKAKVITMANWKGEKVKHSGSNVRTVSPQKFVFVDQHPCVDELRTWLEQDSRTIYAIAKAADISDSTVKRLIDGTTRRPQNATIDMLGKAMGYKRIWTKI